MSGPLDPPGFENALCLLALLSWGKEARGGRATKAAQRTSGHLWDGLVALTPPMAGEMRPTLALPSAPPREPSEQDAAFP